MDRVFQIESLEVFQSVSEQILTQLYYRGPSLLPSHLEDDILAAAKQDIIILISENNFDIHNILEVLNNKGWQQEKIECFQRLIEKNKSEVLYAALNYYNSSNCETVINFNWLVKLVLGTSELKTLKYPLMQLVLSTVNKNGQLNKIMYDTNKDILSKMISALENAIK